MTQSSSPLLSARGLHRSFGRTPALQGASLDVAAGEVVAVTGPSGSGKSTLLHCLAGVTRPDSGVVTYAGRRLDELSSDARTRLRRLEIGLVLQFGQLVPELTALENVALPLLLERRGCRAAREAALLQLERLGVAALADARPGAMSGGEAQRVAIARALVTSPSVVLADEPTGALDTVAGEQALSALWRSRSRRWSVPARPGWRPRRCGRGCARRSTRSTCAPPEPRGVLPGLVRGRRRGTGRRRGAPGAPAPAGTSRVPARR